MKRRRRKVEGQTAYYHLMSRTVNGEALFGSREREVLRKMIWQVADFSGIRVVTYAVMNNNFHLLVEVPFVDSISDEELVRRYQRLYPHPTPWQPMTVEVLKHHLQTRSLEGAELRKMITRRMHDISWFMKTLKHRFSFWFNRSRERFGPLWSDRFKSVLVEGDQWALRTVAAYIDLNPVRAGIVDDPKDYRYCGYGEAVAGSPMARKGLSILGRNLSGYRRTLFGIGSEESEGKSSIDRDAASQVLEREKGRLPLATVLRCRVRYFSDGQILGSAAFVKNRLSQEADPPVRTRRPHPMRGADWQGLAVGVGLRKGLFK